MAHGGRLGLDGREDHGGGAGSRQRHVPLRGRPLDPPPRLGFGSRNVATKLTNTKGARFADPLPAQIPLQNQDAAKPLHRLLFNITMFRSRWEAIDYSGRHSRRNAAPGYEKDDTIAVEHGSWYETNGRDGRARLWEPIIHVNNTHQRTSAPAHPFPPCCPLFYTESGIAMTQIYPHRPLIILSTHTVQCWVDRVITSHTAIPLHAQLLLMTRSGRSGSDMTGLAWLAQTSGSFRTCSLNINFLRRRICLLPRLANSKSPCNLRAFFTSY